MTVEAARRPALDTLRIVIVLGLVFFHSALVFDASDDFYVKNAETTSVTTVLAGLGVVWAMPLLFVVAGIGARHSLGKRGPGRFAVERLLRLGVPLVFATLTIVPVPQWLRLRAEPGYDESYWAFLPRFFDVRFAPADFPFVLQGEVFETGHLWFVVLLLTFSLLLAAAVARLPATARRRAADAGAAAVGRAGVVLLPALPLALIGALIGLEEGLAGWSRWAYLLFFLYGFLIATDDRYGVALRRHAKVAVALAVVAFGAGAPGFLTLGGEVWTGMSPPAIVSRTLFSVSGWCWLVALLGLLDRPRPAGPPRERPVLYVYLAAAALPFYVLHQPIVVGVAYLVVPGRAPIIVEYAVIVTVSMVLIFAVYDILVRRTRVTRFLFGMRAPAGPVERTLTMRVEVERETPLWFGPGAPVRAASAIAAFGDGWLVAQDDATHAAWLRPAGVTPLRVLEPVEGHDTFGSADGTKHLKPDFEAAVAVEGGVLLLGSGSTAARMRAALVTAPGTVTAMDLTAVYHRVAEALGLPLDRLNLEGAARVGDRLRWFQRGNSAAGVPSAAVEVNLSALLTAARPEVGSPRRYDLGAVHGVALAITDAVALPDGRMLVAAAAEDTPNPVDDGPVVGAAIALLDDERVLAVAPVPGGPYKIEGLAVRHVEPAAASLIAVVDADDPSAASSRLDLRVSW